MSSIQDNPAYDPDKDKTAGRNGLFCSRALDLYDCVSYFPVCEPELWDHCESGRGRTDMYSALLLRRAMCLRAGALASKSIPRSNLQPLYPPSLQPSKTETHGGCINRSNVHTRKRSQANPCLQVFSGLRARIYATAVPT